MEISILIATRNRLHELKKTLATLSKLMDKKVTIIVCDDASEDGTYCYVTDKYPNIHVVQNEVNKGYLFNRNLLMNLVKTEYAIILDDDANFLGNGYLSAIADHFEKKPSCGVIAFRIFWGAEKPYCYASDEITQRVQSYVGCGHAWRMKAWHDIPDYQEWYRFYGEEEFASLHLLKKQWKVEYLPEVLIHHRVSNKGRKLENDYVERMRRSLSAGWYNYLIFYPANNIPKRFLGSIWSQLRRKILKGNFSALKSLLLSCLDMLRNLRRILKQRKALTKEEFRKYSELAKTKIYWNPPSKSSS
ncbi:glycosyltransferase family 2 protein [Autumnicola edwardsiae]|uniref:Glycosyltransferase n=1 Tax=Autumnicola edwardsiae TaxID=3075594 RepID=A0ABU3CR82_9FLAO|nr:glycosyltransferase [Zunongwangia sp. F297]MDT0648862.1 glycosyltransferase [Zunongwangia sp. F297]